MHFPAEKTDFACCLLRRANAHCGCEKVHNPGEKFDFACCLLRRKSAHSRIEKKKTNFACCCLLLLNDAFEQFELDEIGNLAAVAAK